MLALGLQLARSPTVLTVSHGLSSLLADRALLEQIARMGGARWNMDAIAFVDAGASANPLAAVAAPDELTTERHAALLLRRRAGDWPRSVDVVAGEEIGGLLAPLVAARDRVHWCHLPSAVRTPRVTSGARRVHYLSTRAPRVAEEPVVQMQADEPMQMPGRTVPSPRRWSHQLHWMPPETVPLVRHVNHRTGCRVVSASESPPGFEVERVLGALQQASLPGTARLECVGAWTYRAVDRSAPREQDPAIAVLGTSSSWRSRCCRRYCAERCARRARRCCSTTTIRCSPSPTSMTPSASSRATRSTRAMSRTPTRATTACAACCARSTALAGATSTRPASRRATASSSASSGRCSAPPGTNDRARGAPVRARRHGRLPAAGTRADAHRRRALDARARHVARHRARMGTRPRRRPPRDRRTPHVAAKRRVAALGPLRTARLPVHTVSAGPVSAVGGVHPITGDQLLSRQSSNPTTWAIATSPCSVSCGTARRSPARWRSGRPGSHGRRASG